MPKKTPKAEKEAASVLAPEEKNVAAKPRTRTTQPKKGSGATGGSQEKAAAKPRTRTAQPKKVSPSKGTSPASDAPRKQPVGRKKPPQQTEQSPLLTREAAPAESESALPPAAVVPAQIETALSVQVEAPQEITPAVPPVTLCAPEGIRRQFLGRLLLLLMVGALLTLSVLIFVYRPTRYSAYSHSIVFLYDADSDTTQVLYDGKPCEENITGELVRSERDSSGSVCAALIGDALYVVRGDDVMKVAADVSDFALSQNGRALTYRTADQKLYYAKTGRKLAVSTVSADVRDTRYCLSPDGEFLFYTYFKNEDGQTHADVFSLSGDKPFLPHTTDIIPVAIADDFEHIFYFNGVGDLYYMNADSEISLCRRRGESEMVLLFDREFEELLIKDADGMTLWRKGESVVLSGLKGTEYLQLLPNQLAVCRELPCAKQYLVRSLDESYYLKLGTKEQGEEMVYLDGDELHTVAFISRDGSHPVVTDKGVFYLEKVTLKDEERMQLFCCPIGQTDPQTLAFDVEKFEVNSDGSHLLYVDHRQALYAARVVSGALDATRICDEVKSDTLCVSASNAFYYRSVAGTLYVSDNGKSPELVSVQGSAHTDVHTAFFVVPSVPVSDGETVDVTYTVYSNHRNRRESCKVAADLSGISLLKFFEQIEK